MSKKIVKTVFSYVAILLAGLAAGYAISHLPALLKPAYTQGDYTAIFPDAQTRIALYGTATCPFCADARKYLGAKNLAFADYDIEKSPERMQEFKAMGARGVPVIIIGDRRISGFNKKAIDAALAKAAIVSR